MKNMLYGAALLAVTSVPVQALQPCWNSLELSTRLALDPCAGCLGPQVTALDPCPDCYSGVLLAAKDEDGEDGETGLGT